MTGAYVDIDRPTFGVRDPGGGVDGGAGSGLLMDVGGWLSDKGYGLLRPEAWQVSVFDPEAPGNGVVVIHRVDGSSAALAKAEALAVEHGEPGEPLEIRAHSSIERPSRS